MGWFHTLMVNSSSFPIPGLSPATRNALRLFVPSPAYCYADTAGTTKSVQDGNVALWKEATGKTINAVQATAGWQPKLRKGAKNIVANSTMVGAGVGVPPTGWSLNSNPGTTGITVAVVGTGTEVIAGVSSPYIDVRFSGTVTTIAASNLLFYQSSAVPTLQFCASSAIKLVAGAPPSGGLNLFVQCRDASTGIATATGNINPWTVGASWTYLTAPLEAPTGTTSINMSFRYDPAGVGATIDCTLRIAQTQVESGLVRSVWAPTVNAPASNGIGGWWLDFDGVQSRLAMSSILYETASNFAVSSHLIRQARAGVVQCITDIRGGVNSKLHMHRRSGLDMYMESARDESNIGASATVVGGVNASATLVSRRSVSSHRFEANSAVSLVTQAIGTITATQFYIGCAANSFGFLDGAIYGLALGDVAINDVELGKVKTYIAALGGQVL